MQSLKQLLDDNVVNFTRVPNFFFEECIYQLSESALKVYLTILRKTIGWQKDKDFISYSQIQKMSNLSENSILKGIKELIEKKLIETQKFGIGKGTRISYEVKNKNTIIETKTEGNIPSKFEVIDNQKETNTINNEGINTVNTSNFAVLNPPNTAKFADTKEILIKKEEEERKEVNNDDNKKQADIINNDTSSSNFEIISKLKQNGISQIQLNNIFTKHDPDYLQEKLTQFEYLMKHNPQKVKGKGRYLYLSIIQNWIDDDYYNFSYKNAKEKENEYNKAINIKYNEEIDIYKQEYDKYVENECDNYLNNLSIEENKKIDEEIKKTMQSEFYKNIENNDKIYNNLILTKKTEYIRNKCVNLISFDDFITQKKRVEKIAA
ncbi:MAG TPA: replication protein [Spirochaetota bacterium]|nr:replication protein [Spirochaetota bacterium]HPY88741.1 replication protein [Spirochaetota bacterium]HQB60050.1 replication protein [Spirochaetota bacterium]